VARRTCYEDGSPAARIKSSIVPAKTPPRALAYRSVRNTPRSAGSQGQLFRDLFGLSASTATFSAFQPIAVLLVRSRLLQPLIDRASGSIWRNAWRVG